MRRIFFLLASFLFLNASLSALAPTCFFIPPEKWSTVAPEALSPLVKVGFVGPAQQGFCPSINLAIEKVKCSLQEYLDVVKKIHKTNRHKDWNYLGTFPTKAGDAALTQIDLPSSLGPMRMLQMIYLKDGTAYILTAAALKKEFVNLLPTFKKVFQSLQISTDLYEEIKDEKKRARAEQLLAQVESAVREQHSFTQDMKEWKKFQDYILDTFTHLGPYWQALLVAGEFKRFQSIVEAPIKKEILSTDTPQTQLQECLAQVETNLSIIKTTFENFPPSASFGRYTPF